MALRQLAVFHRTRYCLVASIQTQRALNSKQNVLFSSTSTSTPSSTPSKVSPDASMVDTTHAMTDFEMKSAVVYSNIISEEEETCLLEDILDRMKRRRYERGHWDAVITGYKEIELPTVPPSSNNRNQNDGDGGVTVVDPSLYISNMSSNILQRIRYILESKHFDTLESTTTTNNNNNNSVQWLPTHAIDLKEDGTLTAHVDSVRFSGGIVAGLSLMSHSIMRLKPSSSSSQSHDIENNTIQTKQEESTYYVDLYLPPRSLYVLSGPSRYHYTHELLSSGSKFHCNNGTIISVDRGRRISIIFRDAK